MVFSPLRFSCYPAHSTSQSRVDLLPGSRLSEASAMLFGQDLLAKYRPWPIGLTWQQKHKPGDTLCPKTLSCLLQNAHDLHLHLHVQYHIPVCTGTQIHHDALLNPWCHSFPTSSPFYCTTDTQIVLPKWIWEVMKWAQISSCYNFPFESTTCATTPCAPVLPLC